MTADRSELENIARQIRGKLIELSHNTSTPHLGSSLSCVDILVASYWDAVRIDPSRPNDPERDRFILSKGHAATTLYAALAYRGFFPLELLDTYTASGGCLAEHPGPGCVPGVEAATGSLGHGLPIGLGMALSARLQKRNYRVFVVMSDGECNEGSVWEAALLAPANKLENLAVVIDYNKWQATGRSNTITSLHPLKEKWEAFGWSAYEVDGHDIDTLCETLANVPDGSGRPVAVVAHTTKGKGVSFMEDNNNWHYRSPNEEEVKKAWAELGLA
jgi:transketolase